MNYIYNIRINLNDKLLNFYEWNECDNVIKISKIPIYLVSTKDYINLLNMNIKLSRECLNSLEIIDNMCLFTNLVDVICIKFTNDGLINNISKLQLIEESEVLDEIKNITRTKLEYSFNNKKNDYSLVPRYENNIINELIEYVKSKKEDKEIIDYLYYEWFKNRKSINKYDSLIRSINTGYSLKHDEFHKIIELIESKSV
jgi:hypothetical protein